MRPVLHLDPDLVRRIVRGNPANLPVFMVHNDDVWPWGGTQLDSQKRIHLRRSDFFNVVVPQIPVNEGIWVGVDVQRFTVRLTAANLDGDGQAAPSRQAEYRDITDNPDKCPECGGAMHKGARGDMQCMDCNYGHRPAGVDVGMDSRTALDAAGVRDLMRGRGL